MCHTETHKSDTKWHKTTSGWHEMTNFMWRILVWFGLLLFWSAQAQRSPVFTLLSALLWSPPPALCRTTCCSRRCCGSKIRLARWTSTLESWAWCKSSVWSRTSPVLLCPNRPSALCSLGCCRRSTSLQCASPSTPWVTRTRRTSRQMSRSVDILPQSHPGAHAVRMETTSSTVKLDMSIIYNK